VATRIAALGVTILLLGGCGGTESLTDTWPPPPVPQRLDPVTGTCHHIISSVLAEMYSYELMHQVSSCAREHKSEIVHVGQFTGEHANRTTPPPDGSPGIRLAYRQCAVAANDVLGGDWHAGWTYLRIFTPGAAAWTGGARWFRCDLVEVANDANVVRNRTGSMRDALTGDRPLAIGCATHTVREDGTFRSVTARSCADRHTAEFTGVVTMTPPDLTRPDEEDLAEQVFDGCRQLSARYLGVPAERFPRALGVVNWADEKGWERGDQSFRCFVTVLDTTRPIRPGATLAGLGAKPVPTI
jgi:hypothetical protein